MPGNPQVSPPVSHSPPIQEIVAVFGQPVAGNPTQYMMEKAFAQVGLDWRYLTLEVAPEDLGDAIRGMRAMGFRGCNLTIPHKVAVIPASRSHQRSGLADGRGQLRQSRRRRAGRRKHRRQGFCAVAARA